MSNLEDHTTQVVESSTLLDDHHDHNHDVQNHHDYDDDDDDGDGGVLRDVMIWRRKKISGVVLVVTTILWTLLQFYNFNFIPLASWTAMAFATLLFLHGSFLRILNKDVPDMEAWEVTEQRAREMGESTKRVLEKGVKWMFYVSCEREWYIFVSVILGLLLLAYVGRYMDLLTLLYSGTLAGMTLPAIYVNKEDVIRSYGEKARVQGLRTYHKFDEKIFSKWSDQLKNKKEKKAKKVE